MTAFQNYETICGGTGAGPGFAGCDAVQSHMTNTRMTDPEVLEKRFPVRLEELCHPPRLGRGGATGRAATGRCAACGFWHRSRSPRCAAAARLRRLASAGGGPGAVGENLVHWPDGRTEALAGNDERDLPAGAIFEMRTPGGGGWGMTLSLQGDTCMTIFATHGTGGHDAECEIPSR